MEPTRPKKRESGNTSGINEVLSGIAARYGWSDRLDEERTKSLFKELLDPQTAACITGLYLRDRILYVRLNSAAARSDLSLRTGELREALRRKTGTDLIDVIRVE